MKWILDRIRRLIAAYLQKPAWGYEPFVPAEPTALLASIKPGDILVIEGHNRISGIIEYLTRRRVLCGALRGSNCGNGESSRSAFGTGRVQPK
jgi:hypothetical protein